MKDTNTSRRLTSKIITKIGILVVIEIVIILSSFAILIYFESQRTFLGNSINTAGKNRFLIANVQLSSEEYRSGSSSLLDLQKTIDTLEFNLLFLKQGGSHVGMELKPLPSQFLNYWANINQTWNDYKSSIVEKVIKPLQLTTKPPSGLELITTKELKNKASELISSSDVLVTKLGEFAKIYSQNLVLLQILLGILNIAVLLVMLYIIVKILKPISELTRATFEIRNGKLDVSVVSVGHSGEDELSVLSQSFNSMVYSMKESRENQIELTRKLERANKELKQKEKLKDEFINIASHELKSPIQPILGLAALAKKGEIDQKEAWNVILRQARKLEQLANNILDVTRIESGNLSCKMDKVSINDIILDVIRTEELNPNLSESVTLRTKLDKPIEIVADKLRITQVLENIVGNAIKFTSTGNITIETHVSVKENKVEFRIVDTGSGIPDDMVGTLFDKFSTKKSSGIESESGTGLGLYISKAIVLAHGGQVYASNNNDHGSTFSIILPIDRNKKL